jgi:hypothetical protein
MSTRLLLSGLSALSLFAAVLAPACGGGDDDGTDGARGGASNAAGSGSGGGSGAGFDLPGEGGQGADQGFGGSDCGGDRIDATPIDVNMLLVIDASGSMKKGDVDNWTPLRSALGTVFKEVGTDVAFGLELFPYLGQGKACDAALCCDVPSGDAAVQVPIGKDASASIVKALAAHTPTGATPTAVALDRALDYFTTGDGKALKGDRYVLLGTDGGPNCNTTLSCGVDACTSNIEKVCVLPDDANCCDKTGTDAEGAKIRAGLCLDDTRTKTQIAALAKAGVKTIVVGLPGANREQYVDALNAFATAGQMSNPDSPPSYYAVDDTAELVNVFQKITKRLIRSCELKLARAPADTDLVNVKIDGQFVPKSSKDGWTLDLTTSPPTVQLQGATCDRVKAEGASSVSVVFGCPTVF